MTVILNKRPLSFTSKNPHQLGMGSHDMEFQRFKLLNMIQLDTKILINSNSVQPNSPKLSAELSKQLVSHNYLSKSHNYYSVSSEQILM